MGEQPREFQHKPGLIVLFGSGEMSPTGRKIHETVFREAGFSAPINIGILETPTGYEVNAIHSWPERMQNFFEKSLTNYVPIVTRIRAWRNDGDHSTNDPTLVDAILSQHYLYCGAGSPGYTVRHLAGSRAWEELLAAHRQGSVLCLGSATAVAVSRWAIPVYEIFKTGADLHWIHGLDFFRQYGLSLAIVPHWNNEEGVDFDTTRCYMGQDRFSALRSMLSGGAVVLGIDEQTAAVFDVGKKTVEVAGKGTCTIINGSKEVIYGSGSTFPFSELT